MIGTQLHRLWFPFGLGPESAEVSLFCLPFAGGGASNFLDWGDLDPRVGVAPIQYPGHETRIDEMLLDDIDSMIQKLADVIIPSLDRPYLLFGYSMGAKLAYALAKRLEFLGFPLPLCLFVAAHLPPDQVSSVQRANGLPDAAFKRVVCEYGGIPDELFDDEEFCSMALPILRADFKLATQPIDFGPLDCPIIGYAGNNDLTASPSEMKAWKRFTNKSYRLHTFAGGHFFFRSAVDFKAALSTHILAARQPVVLLDN